jgi:predicted NBD/HSP70 family sugar kinase
MARKGSNSVHVRHYNERVILETLRRDGQASKAELARSANLTPPAVAGIVDALLEAGFIEQKGRRFGQVGQPSVMYSLAPDGAYSVGLHVGRRSLNAVLMDFSGRVRASESHEYGFPEPSAVVRLSVSSIQRLLGTLPEDAKKKVIGIGLAMPYFLGGWKTDQNVLDEIAKTWETFDLKSQLTSLTKFPVYLENDASAAAVAELVYGVGRNYKNFIYLSLKTFIGGGLVIDGNLFPGPHGNSAAFGPFPVSPSRLSSVPPPTGPFEILLRRASVATLMRHLRSNGIQINRVKDLEYLPSDGQPYLREWQEDCADALAQAIVGSISVIDVDVIIIDGILPRGILDTTISMVSRRFDEIVPDGVIAPPIISGSTGAQAAATGAAILPVYAMFTPDSAILTKRMPSPKRSLLVGSGDGAYQA